MLLGGLQKTTLIDYPGKVAATVFTVGCNFRCPFCYSKELVIPEEIKKHPKISEEYFFDFLEKRKGLLDGVVICGGEPTIHNDLPEFSEKIKNLGYLVKLDTNGSNPEMLKELIDKKLIDYVAMDIKAPKDNYEKAIGVKINIDSIQKSIDILKNGSIDYEFRTTVVPAIHNREDIIKMAEWIKGAKKYFLQQFNSQKSLIGMEGGNPYPDEFMEGIVKEISHFFNVCQIRGLSS